MNEIHRENVECRSGVHGRIRFESWVARKGDSQTLTNPCRRAWWNADRIANCGECARNYMDLTVAGSSPAFGIDAEVAQLVELQTGASRGFFTFVAAVCGVVEEYRK